jgi:hypothetical protein
VPTTRISHAPSRRSAAAPGWVAAALLLGATALLLLPVGWELGRTPNWLTHPSWDGEAFALGPHEVVLAALDVTGSAALLATLDAWRGGGASEAELHAHLSDRGFDDHLGSFAEAAAAWGFPGRWALAEGAAVASLPTPFLAHLHDAGGRLVTVRRIAGGYAYLADPNVGTTLMPVAEFSARSTAQVFLFNAPVSTPGGW